MNIKIIKFDESNIKTSIFKDVIYMTTTVASDFFDSMIVEIFNKYGNGYEFHINNESIDTFNTLVKMVEDLETNIINNVNECITIIVDKNERLLDVKPGFWDYNHAFKYYESVKECKWDDMSVTNMKEAFAEATKILGEAVKNFQAANNTKING